MRRAAILPILLSLVAGACGGDVAEPSYDIRSRLSTEGEVVLELLIGNEGTAPLEPGDTDEAVFLIRAEDGPVRVSASVGRLPTVEPGEVRVAYSWSADLAPGTYTVVWGEEDRAVGATLDVDDTGFGMSGPEEARMPAQIVPAAVSPLVDEALRDVEARGDPGEAVVSGVRQGTPEPDTLVIEITTRSDDTRRVYRYRQTPDGLELATLEETTSD